MFGSNKNDPKTIDDIDPRLIEQDRKGFLIVVIGTFAALHFINVYPSHFGLGKPAELMAHRQFILIIPNFLFFFATCYLFRATRALTGVERESAFLARKLLLHQQQVPIKVRLWPYFLFPLSLIVVWFFLVWLNKDFLGEVESVLIECASTEASPCYKAVYSNGYDLKEFLIMKPGDSVTVKKLTKYATVCDGTYPFVASRCIGKDLFPELLKK